MKKHTALLAVAGLFTAFAASSAQAYTYYLNMSNMSAYPDGTNYVQVDVNPDQSSSSTMDFTVTPLISGATLMGFGFNTVSGISIDPTTQIVGLPSGWTGSGSAQDDGFGTFAYNVSEQGNTDRVNTLSFQITGLTAGVTPEDFFAPSTGPSAAGEANVPFVAHVAGLSNGLTGYFGGPNPTVPPSSVPVPAAVWLFGSGLVGLVAVARRRNAS